jgi:hypothetical protein
VRRYSGDDKGKSPVAEVARKEETEALTFGGPSHILDETRIGLCKRINVLSYRISSALEPRKMIWRSYFILSFFACAFPGTII